MDVSYEEALLDELDGTAMALSKDVDAMVLDDIPNHISDIMERVTKLGICKADGEELVKLGVIKSDLINHLGQYRTTAGLDMVANEVDKSGLVGKAITAGIAALIAVLSFLVFKFFKFVFGLFDSGSSQSGGGGAIATSVAEETISKKGKFSNLSDTEKNKITQLFEKAGEELDNVPIGVVMGSDVGEKFAALSYPKDYITLDWIKVADEVFGTAMEEIMGVDLANREKVITVAKKNASAPSNKVLAMVNYADKVLTDLYGDRDFDPRFKDKHKVVQILKKWVNNKNWERKLSSDQLKMETGVFVTLADESDYKSIEKNVREDLKAAESAKKDLEKVSSAITKDKEYATAIRNATQDPLRVYTLVLTKAIIPWLSSNARLTIKLRRVLKKSTVKVLRIVDFVAGQLDKDPDGELVKNLSPEFIKLVKEVELPGKLKSLKDPILREKPKGLSDLLTTVVSVDLKD